MNHIKACCESIAQTGFGTLRISEAMLLDYKKIVDGYSAISPATKASFSFAKDTDGFFPFGAEYSSLEDQPIDLRSAVNARHTGFGNQPLQLT